MLRELSANEQRLIGNKSLRDSLGWEEDKYNRTKEQLADENLLIVGRGQGGSVGLADAPGTKALKLFISYSHADEKLKSELVKHLIPLKRLHLLETWHDRKLVAGDDWERTISSHLETADIILLLVSIDFINSPYCYDIEMERAMERHDQQAAVVVPVILRNCLWQHAPFARLQAVPTGAKAACSWTSLDDAFAEVAERIRETAEKVRASR